MGPDNRATDVTLPAICSPHQLCPPLPRCGGPGAEQGQGVLASGGRWGHGGDGGPNRLSAPSFEGLCTSRQQTVLISVGPKIHAPPKWLKSEVWRKKKEESSSPQNANF